MENFTQHPYRLSTLTFVIEDKQYSYDFIVVSDPSSFILGNDFLLQHKQDLPEPHYSSINPLSPDSTHPYEVQLQSIIDSYDVGPIVLPPSRKDDYQFQFTVPLESLQAQPYRQYTIHHFNFMQNEIQDLLDKQFIEVSPPVPFYSIPFVVNGAKPRMVIDYRALNKITVPLPCSVPSIDRLLVGLKGKVFSALDLSSAYHHLCLHPSTRSATAFKFDDIYFIWTVVAFGLKNAPEIFSQFLTCLLKPFLRLLAIT